MRFEAGLGLRMQQGFPFIRRFRPVGSNEGSGGGEEEKKSNEELNNSRRKDNRNTGRRRKQIWPH